MQLKRIEITICEGCLNGYGSECHTPGCALFLHKVDLAIDSNLYRIIEEFPQQRASLNAVSYGVSIRCTECDSKFGLVEIHSESCSRRK